MTTNDTRDRITHYTISWAGDTPTLTRWSGDRALATRVLGGEYDRHAVERLVRGGVWEHVPEHD